MLVLRDMIESDIEDYVRWFTVDNSFNDTDAPWEIIETTEENERQSWIKYFNSIKNIDEQTVRRKFEIEVDGKHIGWVSSYYDLQYIDNPDKVLAIGIVIACEGYRGKGFGTLALRKFINYLKSNGHNRLFLQTWSGNINMIHVAKKLGFKEYIRSKDLREVNGIKYDGVTYLLS